ncbi:MAG: zinc-ribbon domain containing protein [Clostridia bacterium]|nr:zinc-ribbon domain containing protein [Clostridia bacterium]
MEQLPRTKLKRKTKKLVCCECGTSFLFTGGEQNYYETHNLSDPKRCLKCRKNRRQQNNVLKEEEHES